jgi:ATP-dependent DNA helicase PIF1
LNSKLRAQAQSQAKLYIRKFPGAADLMIEELGQKLNFNEKTALIQSIQCSIDWIPGLSLFWNRHRQQLTAMIEQLGSPHLFFTLSAADLHWPELHRLIENQRAFESGNAPLNLENLNEQARYNRRIDNLTKYPHIAASFLQFRVKEFLDCVKQIPGFEFVDFWYRFEWQFRGSGHVHGFLWLKDGPCLEEMDLNNPEY